MKSVGERVIDWALVGVIVTMVVLCAIVVLAPTPKCPDGYVLAGGGYGGRYHCIPGAEPIR